MRNLWFGGTSEASGKEHREYQHWHATDEGMLRFHFLVRQMLENLNHKGTKTRRKKFDA
ncbi:MAG: hypothetical protein WCJ07_00800 [Verrucomicrobiota bacterium]